MNCAVGACDIVSGAMPGMRKTKSKTVIWPLLLPALLGGTGAYAVEIGSKSLKIQPTQAIADTQATARRQGALNINGVNWNCSRSRAPGSRARCT